MATILQFNQVTHTKTTFEQTESVPVMRHGTIVKETKIVTKTIYYYLYQCVSNSCLYYYVKGHKSGLPFENNSLESKNQLSITTLWQNYVGDIIFTLCDQTKIVACEAAYQKAIMKKADAETNAAAGNWGLTIGSPVFYPYNAIIWMEDSINHNNVPSVTNATTLFAIEPNENGYTITQNAKIGFGNLQFDIALEHMNLMPAQNNSTYSPNESDISGFALIPTANSQSNVSVNGKSQWYISLNDEDAGTIQGLTALKCLNTPGLGDWSPGFRNTIPVAYNTDGITQTSLLYPILQNGLDSEFILYHVKWKAYDPTNSTLTFTDRVIEISTNQVTGDSTLEWPKISDKNKSHLFAFDYMKMAFVSAFNTVDGSKKILLYPTGNSQLVPIQYTADSGEDRYQLVPKGNFEIGVSIPPNANYEAGHQISLLCGLSGSEFIKITPRYKDYLTPDLMSFTPPSSGDLGSISIVQGAENLPLYYAQPEEASLYNFYENITTGSGDTEALFMAHNVENNQLSSTISFPMLPYGNVPKSTVAKGQDIKEYELKTIAKQRKSNISEYASSPGTTVSGILSTCVTPQGFLVSFYDSGLQWSEVKLAQANPPSSESFVSFAPLNGKSTIPNTLRDDLQSNQLFLVASCQQGTLKKQHVDNVLGTFNSQITLDGWPFEVVIPNSTTSTDYSNVMIMKFSEGTLKEQVQNIKGWNNAKLYNNGDASSVSTWINDYISAAELAVQKSESSGLSGQTNWLKNFVAIVNDPSWNGVLFLKVNVSVQDFPEELQGILAGINLSEFYGHHIGINMNHLEYNSGIEITNSSMFGLINYVAQDNSSASSTVGNEDYAFKVLNLQVMFENSKIQNFSSELQLTTTKWFNETATLNSNTGIQGFNTQAVELFGQLQHHNGVNVYVFSTKPGKTYQFMLESQVINYVEISNASFNTTHIKSAVASGVDTKQIQTQFKFGGCINFKSLGTFDAFSFGSDKENEIAGLAFNNLFVDMNFTLATTESTDVSTVSNIDLFFQPHAITFNMKATKAREGSLFNKFPVTLTKLTCSHVNGITSNGTPSSHGYLPISVEPLPDFSNLSDTWYGFEYNLNLGTPGALAAKMDFMAGIIVAWSPGGKNLQIDVGLRLPGGGGAQKLLSLESILKLSIKEILFEASEDPNDHEKIGYTLQLFNIALKFFCIELPMTGAIDAALFGNPTGNNGSTDLGWYAAYSNFPTNN